MRRLGLLAACAFAAFAAAPASACFAPYSYQLLRHAPDNAPAGAAVIRIEFTNRGGDFLAWRGRVPAIMGVSRMERRRLVGVIRRIDGHAGDVFPVYARVTSCTPDFDFRPGETLTRRAYMVGRFVQFGGQSVFVVFVRGYDGSWEE